MKLLIKLELLLCLFALADWECGTHPDNEPTLKILEETESHRETLSRKNSLAPIRIHVEYYNFDLGSSSRNRYFKNEVMNATTSWFNRVLQVYPVENNLRIRTSDCGGIPVPEDHKDKGVEADLVVYLTTKYESDKGYAAYAGACALQGRSPNNIMAGRAVVNSAKFTGETFEYQMNVMVHEITHLLGFSSSIFRYFRNTKGERYDEGEFMQREYLRGYYKYLIKSPTVLRKAREIFKCSSLEGVELETSGGSGTAGSHWEMRVMYNDFMNSHIVMDPVYSSLSMAVLQDSGWYQVNWDYTQNNLWGKDKGCSFHTKKCLKDGEPQFSEFCAESGRTCDTYHLYKGYCNIGKFSGSLPYQFRYFSDSSVGGTNSYMDYCPYRTGYSNGSCRGTGERKTNTLSVFHEEVGANSRCFEGTLIEKGWRLSGDPYHTACYEVVSCREDRAYVRVWDSIVACPFSGGKIEVDGMNGYLVCPNSDILCAEVPCVNGCYGRGKCQRGVCKCDEGFGGDDCSAECGPECRNCKSSGECTSCKDPNAEVRFGECRCKSGYSFDGVSCKRECNSQCQDCQNGFCVSCVANAYYISDVDCACEDGFTQKEDGSCAKECGPMCAECESSTGKCKECVAHAHSLSDGQCWCDEGYLETGMNSCVAICPELCLDCNPEDVTCSACVKNGLLARDKCHCAAGFVNHEGACVKGCTSLCEDCDLDYSVCNKCKPNAQMDEKGACRCKKGYTEKDSECVKSCGNLCQTCDKNGKCIICRAFSRFNEITQECSCLEGYAEENGSCVAECDSSCYSCEPGSSSVCSGCKPNGKLTAKGSCMCEEGFEMNELGECVKACGSLCITCRGQTCTECSLNAELTKSGKCKCKKGFKEENGKCVYKCPNNCDTCNPETGECVECKGGALKDKSGKCKCPRGSKELKGECVGPCNDLCNECSEDKKACNVCVEGAKQLQGFCTCEEGLLPYENTCESKCNSLCSYCEEGVCKACVDFAQFTEEGSCRCQAGYQRLGGHCDAVCDNLCLECSMCEGNLCTACVENAVLNKDFKCECKEGYYEVDGMCQAKCSSLCIDCDKDNCFACGRNAYLMHGVCYCKEEYSFVGGECK